MRPRTGRGRGAQLAVAAALFAGLAWPAPVMAIEDDHGWTHQHKHDYPNASPSGLPNPNCHTLAGGGAASSGTRPVAPSKYVGYSVAADVPFPGTVESAAHDVSFLAFRNPIYQRNQSANENNGGVRITMRHFGNAARCGVTSTRVAHRLPQGSANPTNQRTIIGVHVEFNTAMSWNVSGQTVGLFCDMRNTGRHELGHSQGLGHTIQAGKMMFTEASPTYAFHSMDRYGMRCIYDRSFCTEVAP